MCVVVGDQPGSVGREKRKRESPPCVGRVWDVEGGRVSSTFQVLSADKDNLEVLGTSRQ